MGLYDSASEMGDREFILGLCREAGKPGPEPEVLVTWETEHACCCLPNVYKASQGDRRIVDLIRRCMGLKIQVPAK
jgi:hypothetical protein